MTILVDMDDVMEQLVAGWIALLNDRYGTHAKYEDVTCWDLCPAFPTLTREQVYDAEVDEALWDYVKPMPGAQEYLKRIQEDGHEVYVVTATKYHTLRKKMETVLFPNFPFIDWHHVIITHNKRMIRGDLLIDDGPHNFEGVSCRKLLFDRGHNRSFDETTVGAVRVHSWEEIYREVCKIAKEMEAEQQCDIRNF